ncbi:MAG: hypothetical protein JWM09_540 [Francisellaceae bacterium]|nr:hypothetical protein [Francisellaceae bacterium]
MFLRLWNKIKAPLKSAAKLVMNSIKAFLHTGILSANILNTTVDFIKQDKTDEDIKEVSLAAQKLMDDMKEVLNNGWELTGHLSTLGLEGATNMLAYADQQYQNYKKSNEMVAKRQVEQFDKVVELSRPISQQRLGA